MTEAPTQTTGPSVFKIAAGVALGLIAALFVLFVVVSAATGNDGADCALDNAERTSAGLAARDCY